MGDKKIYIVAKIFDQQGCLAYLCKTPNEARCLPGTLEALRADGAVSYTHLDVYKRQAVAGGGAFGKRDIPHLVFQMRQGV